MMFRMLVATLITALAGPGCTTIAPEAVLDKVDPYPWYPIGGAWGPWGMWGSWYGPYRYY